MPAALPAGAALVDPSLAGYRVAADHIHPNSLGQRDIAERLRPILVGEARLSPAR